MAAVPLPRSSFVLLALLPGFVACGSDDNPEAGALGCSRSVELAAEEAEPDRQVELLDEALLACASYATFKAEVDQYPGIIGYDFDTYLELRCERSDDEQLRDTPACATLVGPATTPPLTTVADLVFAGVTLDGRTVELRPNNVVEFTGDVPTVVQQTVDIAIESGCPGVIEQRDRWASQVDDPVLGDAASVYAQHAQNVAIYIQCETPPLPGQPGTTAAAGDT
jgi:hypothetical protein